MAATHSAALWQQPSPALGLVAARSTVKRVRRAIAYPPESRRCGVRMRSTATSSTASSMSVRDMQQQFKDARQQMEQDEDLAILMNGLRGTNLNEDDFAAAAVQMRLVEGDFNDTDGEGLPLVYAPDAIAKYWRQRRGAVVSRIAQLLAISGKFLGSLALDALTDQLQANEVKRACEIRDIVTSLGPAYIKLGQALAIRPDLLSPAAMNELQKLCDKVPSFPSDVAYSLIESELGQPWYEIYATLTPEPIAAASLGQVYKGTLKETGETVAVKVQRPYVLETVTIDLYIIRKLGMWLRRFPQINTDVVGLLDEWAARFFEELDYNREGANATKFAALMAEELPQVVVPRTYEQYTSRRVLTSEWLDGEKLSQSQADDVGDLVGVGVICYLKQLLQDGFFHADPHPGNLIRTPDGRLAVLDFGLMTQITDDQKYGMIEAIAHLINRDYERIVEDFVVLGFIPPGTDLKPILPVLARVFDQALAGGGAKGINFQELAADLAQITFDYPFRIPPYFALIIRAIGVLEGIALVGNPEFAIVDEAYPYIAKRLLTDDTPRLQAALRYMVYGNGTTFDAERMLDLLEAFETFTETRNNAATGDRALVPSSISVVSSPGTAMSTGSSSRQALTFVLSKDGALFRELMLDELVKSVDALSREQLVGILTQLGLKQAQVPLLLPAASGGLVTVALTPEFTEEDAKQLRTVSRIVNFLLGRGSALDGDHGDLASPAQATSTSGALLFDMLLPSPVALALGMATGTSASGVRSQNTSVGTTSSTTEALRLTRELAPLLPEVATEILPELSARLVNRITARFIRENFLPPGPK